MTFDFAFLRVPKVNIMRHCWSMNLKIIKIWSVFRIFFPIHESAPNNIWQAYNTNHLPIHALNRRLGFRERAHNQYSEALVVVCSSEKVDHLNFFYPNLANSKSFSKKTIYSQKRVLKALQRVLSSMVYLVPFRRSIGIFLLQRWVWLNIKITFESGLKSKI